VLVFAVVAGALAYGLVVRPAVAVTRARHWKVTPCNVISSAVKRLARDAYDLDIVYEWRHEGLSFRGSRFDFFGVVRQAPQEWAPVLERLRPGQVVTCYVDSAHPEQAAIDRGWNGGVWIPVAVLSVFLATVLALGFAAAPQRATSSRERGPLAISAPGPAGPVALRPRTTPRRRLLRASVLAVSLSAAALVLVAVVVPGWRQGRASWPLTLVAGAFALGGLAQIVRAALALAGMAGPTVAVTTVPEARLGERLVVEWRIERRADLVIGLELALVGREIARYPDWDANGQQEEREEKMEFCRAPLSTERAADTWSVGRADIELPRLIPPTFDAPSNQIAWAIALHAGVRGLPDVAEEYPIRLQPPSKALA
jgi:hypothetical protein